MDLVENNEDLRNNLSAAAHLIHGSSEERFRITYATENVTREEIESVGYEHEEYQAAADRYDISKMNDGWNEDEQGRYYFVRNPALGLWAHQSVLVD